MPDLRHAAIAMLPLAALIGGPAIAADYAETSSALGAAARVASLAASNSASLEAVFDAAKTFGVTLAERPPILAATPAWNAPDPVATPEIGLVAFDLIMSQLALQAGSSYQPLLRSAQSSADAPQALILASGATTVGGFYDAVAKSPYAKALSRDGDVIVAHLPIVVWSDATLAIGKGETLRLESPSGAFLLDAGRLVIDGGTVAGDGKPNPRLPGFRPFVLVALAGTTQIHDARFTDLGFPEKPPMTGLAFLSGGTFIPDENSIVADSVFDRDGALDLIGATGVNVTRNVFHGPVGAAITATGAHDATIAGNVVEGSKGAHGIKLTAESTGIDVTGNIVVGSGLNGIYIDGGSAAATVTGNFVTGSAGSAVGINGANCIVIAGNTLIGNHQNGIGIKGSLDVAATDNLLLANRRAGILVHEQPARGKTILSGNRLSENKTGVSGLAAAQLTLTGNDFDGQSPRLLDGELNQFTVRLLAAMASDQPQPVIVSGAAAARALPHTNAATIAACASKEGA